MPDVLRLESPRYLGSEDIPKERYTSREWHRREVDQLWSKVWQFACREEHIPDAGDYIVYDIAELSFLVIRQEDGSIKAYPNACLHRGRQLKEYDGHCSEIRCPFHGFAWQLDGAARRTCPRRGTSRTSTSGPTTSTLPECSVGTWAGFVFINPDPDAGPLDEFLGELDEQFEVWDLEQPLRRGARVAKVIRANWKIAQEAFCEAYHVNATHPQILPYLGDANSQVDVWDTLLPGDHARRHAEPAARRGSRREQEMLRSMLDVRVDQEAPFDARRRDRPRVRSRAAASRERWRADRRRPSSTR